MTEYVHSVHELHFDLIQTRDHDDPATVIAEGGPIQLTASTILRRGERRGWLTYPDKLVRMTLEADASQAGQQHVFDALAGVRRAAVVTALMAHYDDEREDDGFGRTSVWYWATTPWMTYGGSMVASSVRSPYLRRDLRTGAGGGWFFPSADQPDLDHPFADLAARAL